MPALRLHPSFSFRFRGYAFRLLLILLLFVWGCAPRRPPQPLPTPPPAVLPSPEELLTALEHRRQTLTSLRGLARIKYKDSHDQGSAKQAIAVAVPNRFRLELFSLIGIASLSTCDGQTFATYFPKEKILYRGAATPLNIARFIRLTLSPRDITSLLLGVPAFHVNGNPGTVDLDAATGWYRLTLTDPPHGIHVLWFNQKPLLMRWEMRTATSETIAQITLTDYRAVGDIDFPFEITLSDLQAEQHASLVYTQVELNPQLSDALFTLGSIRGVQEIDLDTASSE